MNESGWLKIPASRRRGAGYLLLREPPDADVAALQEQLKDGRYSKPFVFDDGKYRRLHFGLDYVQSEMRIDQPQRLSLIYVRKMLAFLLFQPQPRHVLIIGLGGGSHTRFCYEQLPTTRVTTLEISADVIACAPLFGVPDPDSRLRILQTDAVPYLAATRERADVVLFDGCDQKGVAEAFRNEDFYRDVQRSLSPHGVLVTNLIGPEKLCTEHLRLMARTFSGRIIVLKVRTGGNRIAFAFKNPRYQPDWRALNLLAEKLQQRHSLDFPGMVLQLRGSEQIQAG